MLGPIGFVVRPILTTALKWYVSSAFINTVNKS